MSRRKTEQGLSALDNNLTFIQYVDRLTELSISMFNWQNLPPTVDARYLELKLFENGNAVFFYDEDLADDRDTNRGYLALDCISQGRLDVYGNPIDRRAYSGYNNYQKQLTNTDSVIIWNNLLRTNSILAIRNYAKRLYNLDRIIDVNANAQKTPVLIQCDEKQKLTMKNLYMQYDGNQPFIFGDKNLDINGLKVLKTDAPYVADNIYTLKTQIWNEALTYLGISNISTVKKERMITDEVQRNMGGTIASRYSRLEARRKACEQINEMFGLNISVDYREDVQLGIDDIENESLGGLESEGNNE